MVENSESNLSGIHRTYEHKSPQVLPNAEAALWTGPAAINVHFHVWFYLAEQEGAAQSVTLGQTTTTLASGKYWLYQYVLPANGILDWTGPFLLSGTDDIRGHDNGGGGDGVTLNLRIEWVW
jgi:hypothetical protein